MHPLAVNSAVVLSVTATSAVFDTVLSANREYAFVATAATWIKQGTEASPPTASAASGSSYVPANTLVVIHGRNGAKVAAIRASADATACLTALAK